MIKEKILNIIKQHGWSQDQVSDLNVKDGLLTVCLEINPDEGSIIEDKRQEVESALKALDGITETRVILTAERDTPPDPVSVKTRKPPVRENLKPDNIKHIIAVASGKGGVGKSTVSANLATSLSKQGLKVGIMDADIYGPSMPMMMGLSGKKAALNDQKKLDTFKAHNIDVMSIGFLVDVDQPMIWRGPMVQSAIRQFLVDVSWPKLDVLVVDMPPGTGDAQLTMAQKVPLSGAVIVSTPQDIALIDAAKAIEMFHQTNVPILGIIENMSFFCCPNCDTETPIFGENGVKQMAQNKGIGILGEIPLNPQIRENADKGQPIALDSDIYDKIAENVKEKLLSGQEPKKQV